MYIKKNESTKKFLTALTIKGNISVPYMENELQEKLRKKFNFPN